MAKKGKRKIRRFKWNRLLIGVLLLIFVIIILFRFAELQQITALLKEVNLGWLVAALVAQFAVFAFIAGMYKVILTPKRKEGISFWYLFKTSIAMLFVDHTLPSFSASGNVLLYHVTRKKKIREGKASLLVSLNVFLNFLFYFIMLIVGLAYLLISKQIISFGWIWVLIIIIVVCFVLLTRILFTVTGQRHFKAVMRWLLQKWPKAQKRTLKLLANLYEAKKDLKKGAINNAVVFAFFSYIFKIAAIGAVFLALAHLINPGILIIGYVISIFLSTISYIRIGVYEATMTVAYSTFGIAYNVALTATLLYRAIAFWLPMLIGFIFFRNLMKNNNKSNKK